MTNRFSAAFGPVLFLSCIFFFSGLFLEAAWPASSPLPLKKTLTITGPGIEIEVPKTAPSSGPIPITVKMVADMKTYSANNGILDKVLDIVLIRRDAPGLRIVRKIDPGVWMAPETPLPPPTPGADTGNPGFISEERQFNLLDFGAAHDGSADYYVMASFAGRVTPPVPLSVENRFRKLAPGDAAKAPPITPEVQKTLPQPPASRGVIFTIKDGRISRIEGGVRGAVPSPRLKGGNPSAAFLTLVAVRLSPTGGICSGTFLLDADAVGGDYLAQFSIPVTRLVPRPARDEYLIFVFSANERANPVQAILRINHLNKGQ